MPRGKAFERHVHEAHQLAWAPTGVLMVELADRCWVLPPQLALWIPGGVWHATAAVRASVMQGLYLDPVACPPAWSEPTVLSISPLARHLIAHLDGDLPGQARMRAEAVLLDVLRPVEWASIEVPLPADARACEVAGLLLADPADPRGLDDLARAVGSSPRTLLRLFLADTQLTFHQWRLQARIQAAVALLAEGESVSRVAARVGYATPSSFVAAFRRVTGHTPAAYVGRGHPPRR